ncbi:hypothetical protein F66182_11351, partial [Fusarium sp. NRRL 66182]
MGADPYLADDLKRTPLMYAVMSRKASNVQLLLGSYFAVNIVDATDAEGRTALSYAAERGTYQILGILLSGQLTDPDLGDNKNRTPLSYAAQYWTLDMVKRLLIESNRMDADSKCSGGISPLSWAIERKVPSTDGSYILLKEEDEQHSIVRLFLDTGRNDINTTDNAGRTPLIRAVFHQRYYIVALLLDYGCDIHIQDNGGKTALDWAQWNGNEKIIQLLR